MTMTADAVIGIDVGTTNFKLLVLDAAGARLAESSVTYPLDMGPGGQVTQDPELWWTSLEECLARVGRQMDLRRVGALALSSQGETLICCDNTGRALAPAISWMDTRAAATTGELQRLRDDWTARTGKPIATYCNLAKIHWLRRHRPELIARTRRFCQVADYLIYRLTGRWVCDLNVASFSSAANVWERGWDVELCRDFDLEDKLPEIGEAGTIVGPLRPELRQRWGLRDDVQLVLGGHDQGCAVLGAGPPTVGSVFLSAGTAWVLYAPTRRPAPSAESNAVRYCHAWPDLWATLASYTGCGALNHWIDRFCRAERFEAEQQGRAVYDWLLRDENLAEDLIVIPYLFGAVCPDNDPAARAALLDLEPAHTPANVACGFALAVVFETRRNLECLRSLGVDPGGLVMSGGGARGRVWPQWVADACRLPISVMRHSDTAPLGAAFLAGCALGFWPDGRLPDYPIARRCEPRADRAERFDALYERYLRAVEMDRRRRRPEPADTPAEVLSIPSA